MTEAESAPAWEDPRRVLARHQIVPKKRFSQNFIVSRSAVERIVAAIAPAPGERVVELGPGLGTLTAALLRAGAVVLAIEKDPAMIAVLKHELGEREALEIRQGDATRLDLTTPATAGGRRAAVVGNLPYAVTGGILKNLVANRSAVDRAVLMVQREVLERLTAAPGEKAYGALTVFTRAAFSVERIFGVPAGAFYPRPRVESAVLRMLPLHPPRATETEAFRLVVRAAFGTRRKTLTNALGRLANGRDQARDVLRRVGIDGRRRGETLSIEEFAALAGAWDAAPERQRG